MASYITVDGGTTNTRVCLVREGRLLAVRRLGIGAGAADPEGLKRALARAIPALLSEHGMSEHDIRCILASGMITSEKGLCHLPHIPLPAGRRELHEAMHETLLPELSSRPTVFLRGVRSFGEGIGDTDMMRGEETELMGLPAFDHPCLCILPGSHSKHISVDEHHRIVSFSTVLSGELLAAVLEHTILKFTTDFGHAAVLEADLVQGYLLARERGMGEALFKTRILSSCFGASPEQCFSFLLGCVLFDEIEAILRSEHAHIVIGGQGHFRKAIAILLSRFSDKEITVLSDETVAASTALGAISIYEHSDRSQ